MMKMKEKNVFFKCYLNAVLVFMTFVMGLLWGLDRNFLIFTGSNYEPVMLLIFSIGVSLLLLSNVDASTNVFDEIMIITSSGITCKIGYDLGKGIFLYHSGGKNEVSLFPTIVVFLAIVALIFYPCFFSTEKKAEITTDEDKN